MAKTANQPKAVKRTITSKQFADQTSLLTFIFAEDAYHTVSAYQSMPITLEHFAKWFDRVVILCYANDELWQSFLSDGDHSREFLRSASLIFAAKMASWPDSYRVNDVQSYERYAEEMYPPKYYA